MKHITKNIIPIVIGVVLLGGIYLLARPQNDVPVNATSFGPLTALAAAETTYDFGRISMAAGKVSHAFAVRNTGSEPVLVEKLYTSCMCTTASLKTQEGKVGPLGMPGHGFLPSINKVIAPGEEATVEVVFDPAAHGPAGVGRIERVVFLENAGAKLQVGFSATVTP